MSKFVEECLREWKRLRVPDPIANEMAADLAADLAEAEADGTSAELVLGTGAFDPRAFAASWAAERGLIDPQRTVTQPLPVIRPGLRRRPRLPAAIAAGAVVATILVALALVSYRSGSVGVAKATPLAQLGPRPPASLVVPIEPEFQHRALLPAIGLIILLIGFVGLVLWLLYWSPWAGPGREWRRRAPLDENFGGRGRY